MREACTVKKQALSQRWDIWLTIVLFLIAIPLEYKEPFSFIEDQTLSFRQLLRMEYGPAEHTKLNDDIFIVNTDEQFFKEYKSFPLRRTDIAQITSTLRKLGAKVVAVDLLMDFPSSYGEDEPTAEVFKEVGNVLVVSQGRFNRNNEFTGLNYPTPVLQEVTKSGYTNISSSSSLVTMLSRLNLFPQIIHEKDGWPFAVQALAMFKGVEPSFDEKSRLLTIGDIKIQLDQFNSFYIDFPKLPHGARFLSEIRGLSAMEILQLDENEYEDYAALVKGKIVLVGDTSEVSHDWFDTPVGMVYGVEIIADTISTLMAQGPLMPASFTAEVISALLFMFVLVNVNLWLAHPGFRAILVASLFATFIGYTTWAYVHSGVIYSMSYVLLAGFLSYLVINLKEYLAERNQKAMIKDTFGHYLSPKVVEILVKDPSKLQLGGQQREMTAYFSDVAGFSSISEKLTPGELVQLLNEYLTEMCNIIADQEGTVDKFEGDAIIAFWGAPLDQPDHAIRACHASIDMQNLMVNMRKQLQEAGRPLLNVRMGINTGPMVVGNMGSKQRMDYTIMGDAVNLAARLEGANKFYSTYTMISEFTHNHVKDAIECRELDTVRVVGKKEPITIYEVLQRKGQMQSRDEDLMAAYHKALEIYKGRDFKAAMAAFEKALQIVENDGPSLTYLDRCKLYMESPPADDWDGVFNFTSKG
ncbi:adenylate/guanylate cyclase [Magnetococcus marinus MC-1]|uniref:Adenylate/guanylate cyclase n=1 Tax=Magnetococcus marinus (strain ATCC BAA-1437 / JCM 17883 / MC-1) TaxID=156889 RepID=A0LDY9_MAGMM|nr:adenylate/guanylate cyclase [Magnetococcus marinus MC-1]